MRRIRSVTPERLPRPTSLEVAERMLRVHLTLASDRMAGGRPPRSRVRKAVLDRGHRRRGA